MIIWTVLTASFIAVTGFGMRKNDTLLCKEIVISVSDSLEHRFITSNQVRKLIEEGEEELQGYPVESINTMNLEVLLEKNPYVSNAEVYMNVEGKLFADVYQRKPLIRVMPSGGEGYYIDTEWRILPLSDQYTPNVLLVSGNVNFSKEKNSTGALLVDNSEDRELNELMSFTKYAADHPFWRNQIVQVYRAKNGDFEIIPRVGAHQIIFGSMQNYKEKLEQLKLLYDQGLKKYGWNRYDKINLKYSNQIICTKR